MADVAPLVALRRLADRQRALVMVSRYDHCLVDLLHRQSTGELAVDIPLVVSNHADLGDLSRRAGAAFLHVGVTRERRGDAEQRLLELVEEYEIDFVVLARYMQILSNDLCAELHGRVINIHHSFLPSFKGAKPYHQAFDRGVKLIGATAHFVTADLDEGPIIAQGVTDVTHRDSVDQFIERGRDVERTVLTRSVKAMAENRIFLIGHRTVVLH